MLVCYYFSVIRLYLVEGRVVEEVDNERAAYDIINLTVTATENELINYYPRVEELEELDEGRKRGFHSESAYRGLYEELESKIEEERLIENQLSDKAYVVFPYRW